MKTSPLGGYPSREALLEAVITRFEGYTSDLLKGGPLATHAFDHLAQWIMKHPARAIGMVSVAGEVLLAAAALVDARIEGVSGEEFVAGVFTAMRDHLGLDPEG